MHISEKKEPFLVFLKESVKGLIQNQLNKNVAAEK